MQSQPQLPQVGHKVVLLGVMPNGSATGGIVGVNPLRVLAPALDSAPITIETGVAKFVEGAWHIDDQDVPLRVAQ